MKKINTRKGVFLITYTQKEIDNIIKELLDKKDSDGCINFMSNIRSFNYKSEHYLKEIEAIELTGLEFAKSKGDAEILYTNYNGTPLGIPIEGAKLYYTNPVSSLKSAFDFVASEFDFEKDFFHININK